MPRFSVIIPTFNRLPLLQTALASVWRQIFTDYEIIVVDDGSTDGTWEWLMTQSPRLLAYQQANAGPGPARNLGARHASGEYLVFLDSDDIWFPWSLEIINQAIEQSEKPAILQTSCLYDDSPGIGSPEVGVMPVVKFLNFPTVLEYAMAHPVAGAGATVIRLDIWRQTNGFPVGRIVGEDIHLMFQLGLHGPIAFIQSPPVFKYQKHQANTTGNAPAWFQGACVLLTSEIAGEFPGTENNQSRRRHWLARDAAYRSLQCLKLRGGKWFCFGLYFKSFRLQLETGNWAYLLKTPVRFLLSIVGLWPPRNPPKS